MTEYKVGDKVRIIGAEITHNGKIVQVVAVDSKDHEYPVAVDVGDGGPMLWCGKNEIEPVRDQPEIGKEIAFEDIQVGDTVRRVYECSGAQIATTVEVSYIGHRKVQTSQGYSVGDYGDGIWFLVHRPERDAEVQAIMDTLGVDEDTAADYHSKGARIHVDG